MSLVRHNPQYGALAAGKLVGKSDNFPCADPYAFTALSAFGLLGFSQGLDGEVSAMEFHRCHRNHDGTFRLETPIAMEPASTLDQPVVRQPLRNHVAALVLGIASIFPGCLLAGLIGVTLGIVALAITKNEWAEVRKDKARFIPGHVANMNAGRICAIIGLCTSGIILMITLLWMAIWGTVAVSFFELLRSAQ